MPLSDLECARESAARLAQRGRAAGRETAEASAPTYARLKPKTQAAAPPVAVPASVASPPPLPVLALNGDEAPSWDVLLQWLQDSTRAQAVFVVDCDGLPVAQLGALQTDDLDALGARLSFAYEQASRMRSSQGALDSIFIELDGTWLSGIRVAASTGSLLFAILSPEPLSVSLRDRLGNMLLEVLA